MQLEAMFLIYYALHDTSHNEPDNPKLTESIVSYKGFGQKVAKHFELT